MASSYIQLDQTTFWPTHRFRKDTYCIDSDIANDPEILAERNMYERRKHLIATEQDERMKNELHRNTSLV